MKEKLFRDSYEKIDVPQDDVRQAIQNGIRKADGNYIPGRVGRRVWKTVLPMAAAVVFVATSFMITPVSQVLAKVPVVGNLYTDFNDLVGRNLESQQLITQINDVTSNEGIGVTITSAYYDGGVVGVTFDLTGDIEKDDNGQYSAFYELFGGDSTISDSKEIAYLNETETGFTGHIQHYYPKNELPENATIPLEFTRVGDQEGNWKFDVPIEQLSYEVVDLKESRYNADEDVRVTFDSVIKGEASTTINYTATFLKSAVNNQVRLDVYDDQGRKIDALTDGIDLDKINQDNHVLVKGRTIIHDSLQEKTDYIEIHPMVAIEGENPNQPIELEPVRINLHD